MRVSKVVEEPNGWRRFNLGVGGFVIKNCRWHPSSGAIRFPTRRNRNKGRYQVVFTYGRQVNRLRNLLQSGETETPRDRRPCKLKVRSLRMSREENMKWYVFDFTLRGFTILGCRWMPATGSIQLPVTFFFNENNRSYLKKRVVCALGVHINRLRKALEERLDGPEPEVFELPVEVDEDGVPVSGD